MTFQHKADRQLHLAQTILSGVLFDRSDQFAGDPLATMAGKHSQAIQIDVIRVAMVKDTPDDCLWITSDEGAAIRQFAPDNLGIFMMRTGGRV